MSDDISGLFNTDEFAEVITVAPRDGDPFSAAGIVSELSEGDRIDGTISAKLSIQMSEWATPKYQDKITDAAGNEWSVFEDDSHRIQPSCGGLLWGIPLVRSLRRSFR
jgi:hypothetical protein